MYPQRINEARHGAVIKSWVGTTPSRRRCPSFPSSRRRLRRRVSQLPCAEVWLTDGTFAEGLAPGEAEGPDGVLADVP